MLPKIAIEAKQNLSLLMTITGITSRLTSVNLILFQ